MSDDWLRKNLSRAQQILATLQSAHSVPFPSLQMTSSSAPTLTEASNLNRNTLNQRASRARRRTYIRDLERRLHAHEAQGVQATAEVQAAARRVTEENRALKEEVRLLRERSEALEKALLASNRTEKDVGSETGYRGCGRGGRLRGSKRAPSTRAKSRRTGATRASPDYQQALTTPAGLVPAVSISTNALPSHRSGLSTSTPSPIAATTQLSNAEASMTSTYEDAMILITSPSDFPTPDLQGHPAPAPEYTYPSPAPTHSPSPSHSHPGSQPEPCRLPSRPNSTPCLQAALIIASMRGMPSNDITVETEILPELGC